MAEASLGHVEDEHVAQLSLLNEIEEAIARGAGPDEVGRLLDHFVQHANAHFTSEQLLMRETGYAAYERHVLEHDLLMSQARRFLRDVAEGRGGNARAFVVALRDWLVAHMRTTDAALDAYLEGRGGAGAGGSAV
jgi:hemerythrin-like metal-binding protein